MISTRGIQQAQQGNLKLMRAIKPEAGLGRSIQSVAYGAHRMSVAYTHVITGSLRGSHRLLKESASRFRIFIDPSSVNPVNRIRPSIYGVVEHRRGGTHAFYERTSNSGGSLLAEGATSLIRELP